MAEKGTCAVCEVNEAFGGGHEAERLAGRHHAQVVQRHEGQQNTAQGVEPDIAFAHVLLVVWLSLPCVLLR